MDMNTARATRQQQQNQMQSAFSDQAFFVYPITINGVTDGSTEAASFTVQANSWFMLDQMTAVAYDAATGKNLLADGTAAREIFVQLQDSGSDNNLCNNPVPLESIFGSATQPFIVPGSRMMRPTSLFTATITQTLTGGKTVNYTLNFIGRKLYP